MKNVLQLSLPELEMIFEEEGEKKFRARQLLDWIYKKSETKLELMTTFSHSLREKLAAKYQVTSLTLAETVPSKDKETCKFLFSLSDNKKVESVLISSFERRTLCVSCSVGCPVRCAFCASGRFGLIRLLTAEEIVGQFLHVNRVLREKGENISHIVYMGMGEPFENYEAVVSSIRTFISPDFFNISQRRITVSTVGVIEGIERLQTEPFHVTLVLSLHASTQEKRKRIIPYARKYELSSLLESMERYRKLTNRDITYEYILIDNFNDSKEDAKLLAALLRGKKCTVNLIPYNPVDHVDFRTPATFKIAAFQEVLQKEGIRVTWRYRKGDDISAACGQLALREEPHDI